MDRFDNFLRSCDPELMLNTVEFFVKIGQHMSGVKEDIAERINSSLFSSLHDGYSLSTIGNTDNVNWECIFVILKTIHKLTNDHVYAQVFNKN